jgi:regulator of protease activity HflC (stomatin/prohibitin superfamily)
MEYFFLVFLVLVIGLIASSIFTVRQKTAVIVELFGKFYAVKAAGLRLKPIAPFGRVAGIVNLKIQEVKQSIDVKTLDNAFLIFPVAVQFRAIESKAKEAFYELQDPVEQISSYTLNIIRSSAAGMAMNDLYSNKDSVSKYVEEELREELSKFGYEVIRVLIDQPQPSQEVADAFNRVIASQRLQEAAKAEAEGLKIKLVGEAQAEAESLRLKAQAYVDQRQIMAAGISVAMGELRDGLQNVSDREILDYFAGIDYRDTIREASKGKGSIIVTPISNPMTDILAANVVAGRTKIS